MLGERIVMCVGDATVPVRLGDTAAARALAAHLPLELRMSVSSVGCCGQLPFSLPHGATNIHPGWSDGDLNYKPEGDWLALFLADERNSARYGGQVTLGHVEAAPTTLQGLAGTFDARIERAERR